MADVESQDIRHGVCLHDGDQMSIVGLLSCDAVPDHSALPRFNDIGSIWQKMEQSSEARGFCRSPNDSHAETVILARTGGHGPEFDKILDCHMKRFALASKRKYRAFHHRVMRVMPLNGAQQDVGIG